ncbi:calcium binding EGF domain protein [Cooperia oncophora]
MAVKTCKANLWTKFESHSACLSVRLFNGSLGSVCECEPNYRFNNVTQQCEDIDECAENRHNCDPASSTCVNEDGGFRCECYEGYEGTGGVCVDIDECERGVAGCHSMAMCINQPGSCGCKCVHGFTGDGTQCNAMKREANTTCTPEWIRLCKKENRTCHIDVDDVPECGSCLEGYQLVNGTCQRTTTDQDGGNCADPSKNNCDVNAECIDVRPGRHFCTCKIGYIGDGMRCDDIDECALNGICDPHATCHNSPGSFNCTCNSGYIGSGHVCEAVNTTSGTNITDRPNCHLDARLCHANAECKADGNCKCRHGYEGDGIQKCTGKRTRFCFTQEEFLHKHYSEITNTSTTFTSTSASTTLLTTSTPNPKGIITEIDENEVVQLIPGDTGQKTTATQTTSSKDLGKQIANRGSIVGFQSSTVQPSSSTSSLTTDHDRNHTTITTSSISPSTTDHTTPLIHESSTKTTVTESSSVSTVSGIATTQMSSITPSNLTSDGAKPTTTTSVHTNQPQGVRSTSDMPRGTTTSSRNVQEVTSSMIIFKKSSREPEATEEPPDVTAFPTPPDEELLSSSVLHRESTTSPTSPSSISNTIEPSSTKPTTNALVTAPDAGVSRTESTTLKPSQNVLRTSPFPTPKELTIEEMAESKDKPTTAAVTSKSDVFKEEGSGEDEMTTLEPLSTPSEEGLSSSAATDASSSQSTTVTEDSNATLTVESSSSSSLATVVMLLSTDGEKSHAKTATTLSHTSRTDQHTTASPEKVVTSTVPSTEKERSKSGSTASEMTTVSMAMFTEDLPETSTFAVEISVPFTKGHRASVASFSGSPSATSTPGEVSGSTDGTEVTTATSPGKEALKTDKTTEEPAGFPSTTSASLTEETPELSTLEVETSAAAFTKAHRGSTTATSASATTSSSTEDLHSTGGESSQGTTAIPKDNTTEESSIGVMKRNSLHTISAQSHCGSQYHIDPRKAQELTGESAETSTPAGSESTHASSSSSEASESPGEAESTTAGPVGSTATTSLSTGNKPTRLTGIPQEPLTERSLSHRVPIEEVTHPTTSGIPKSDESTENSSPAITPSSPFSSPTSTAEPTTTPGSTSSEETDGTTTAPLFSTTVPQRDCPPGTHRQLLLRALPLIRPLHQRQKPPPDHRTITVPSSSEASFRSTATTSAPLRITEGTTLTDSPPHTISAIEVTTTTSGDLPPRTSSMTTTSTVITHERTSQPQSTTTTTTTDDSTDGPETITTSTSQASTAEPSSALPADTSRPTSSQPSLGFQTTEGEQSTTSAPTSATSSAVPNKGTTVERTTGDLTSSSTGPVQPTVPNDLSRTNTTTIVTTASTPTSQKSSTTSAPVATTTEHGEKKSSNSTSSTAQSTSPLHKITESTVFTSTAPSSEETLSTEVPRTFDREGQSQETGSPEETGYSEYQRPSTPESPPGPADRVSSTLEPDQDRTEKPVTPGSVSVTSRPPDRQPSTDSPARVTEQRGTSDLTTRTDTGETRPTPSLPSEPDNKISPTPGPVQPKTGKQGPSGLVGVTSRPPDRQPSTDLPGRVTEQRGMSELTTRPDTREAQPISTAEPSSGRPSQVTGPRKTFELTPRPDTRNTQRPSTPESPPGPADRVSSTLEPDQDRTEKPVTPGSVSVTSRPPDRQPSTDSPGRVTQPRGASEQTQDRML